MQPGRKINNAYLFDILENKSKGKVNYQSLNLVPLDLVKQYVY